MTAIISDLARGERRRELRSASGLFNLMRNLGGAVGVAVVNTWLQDNARLETARLGEALGQSAQAVSAAVTELAHRLAAATPDAAQALMMARALIGRTVGREALTLAFDDVFRLMAWIFLAALVMVPFAKSAGSGAAAPADAH